MRKVLVIARRDYDATVRTKAFIFGLVITPILFGGGSLGLSLLKGKPDLKDRRIAVLDRTGVAAGPFAEAVRRKSDNESFNKKTGERIAPRYVVEILTPERNASEQMAALSDRVRRRELAAFIEIGRLAVHQPEVPAGRELTEEERTAAGAAYYTNAGGFDEMRSWLSGPINDSVRWARLSELGIDRSRVEGLARPVTVERLGLVERDPKTGAIAPAKKRSELEGFFVPFSVALILGMIVMVGSAPMLQNVTQDKSQRIVEMLLAASSPLELMAGKVLGAVGVSLTSSILYVAGGALAVNAMGLAGVVPLSVLAWFYAYLLAEIVMLCALAAALGAACSTPQDAQNLAIVLLAPCLIPMFLLVTVIRAPSGMMATVMSLIPPFTPMLMLLRQVIPNAAPAWQPWVGMAGVLLFTAATVWAASRIFRVAILMHGKTPRLSDFARWALKG